MSVLVTPRNTLNDTLSNILNGGIKHDVQKDPMIVWDKGVFLNELHRQGIVLRTGNNRAIDGRLVNSRGLKRGTYKGTRMALTEMYSLIEEGAAAHFDSKGYEPIIPINRNLEEKKRDYQWSNPEDDGYPPHLQNVPDDEKDDNIFDQTQVEFVQKIASFFDFLIPEDIANKGTPYAGPRLNDCERYNHDRPVPATGIMGGQNLGNKEDWYSDFRFAHQHLSGVNPATIEKAPLDKVQAYINEAGKQGLKAMKDLLSEGKDLLIQDYSYFRKATGVSDDEAFQSIVVELNASSNKPTERQAIRYACAPVVIFQLHSDGRLHPLAITLDYKGTLDKSVTIFNRRLTPYDKAKVDEKDDWPWRYAKTCAQTADWARHEIAVHLVDTHFIEEVIIVATNRTVPEDHLLFELLRPHWFRTLPLNFAARNVLVPLVIARISGLGPSTNPKTNRALGLVKWSFKNFNFQERYIPKDLKNRGFNLGGEKGDKYRNYPYASNMFLLWEVIRTFVKSVLETKYKSDKEVQADPYISDWCNEIQTKGQVPTFPSITTMDQLIDAVTMIINIASPQHTAVNYLQDFYYSFIPAKPAALCAPLPTDLKTLQAFNETDLTAALPIGTDPGNPKWKDWLLSAQLPELLSYKVDERYNLLTYAQSLYNVNMDRTKAENKKFDSPAIAEAAKSFYSQLLELKEKFIEISKHQTEGSIENTWGKKLTRHDFTHEKYKVLHPDLTAVSILI